MGVKIINLPEFSGLPEDGDYFAVTDGQVTAKLNYKLLAQAIIEGYEGSELAGSEQSIQNALSEIVNQTTANLATKEDIDNNGEYTGISNKAMYIKKHGFVHFWGSPTNVSLSTAQWTNLGVTMPEGYRPPRTISAPCIFGNQGQYAGLIRVAADGTVQCFCLSAITNQLAVFNLMYAVAEEEEETE